MQEFKNDSAFAVLKADGTVVTWGDPSRGGDSSGVSSQLTDVTQIFSNYGAFAALKGDGSVVTWGNSDYGGDSSTVSSQLTDVTKIFSTGIAFAALKGDGTVVTWGHSDYGGDSSTVSSQLTDVSQIFSTYGAFAALKGDGSVVTWGQISSGGYSGTVSSQLTDVTQIFSNDSAFAALKGNGSVVTWGNSYYGGNSSTVSSQLTDVSQIFSTYGAFAALKGDGSVVSWGLTSHGGDSANIASQLTDVSQVFSNTVSFAALKTDGSVVTWGSSDYGGDSSTVSSQLTDVSRIFATGQAFAALKDDGSVVTWGNSSNGGNSSSVVTQLTEVISIVPGNSAFAALKSDGSVVTWGASSQGGDSSGVSSQLTNVTQIFSTDQAFAGLKGDGSIVTWGSSFSGGDSSSVADQLVNVVSFANPFTDDRLIPGSETGGQGPVNPYIALHYGLITGSGDQVALSQLATLGDSVDVTDHYSLVLTAQSLVDGWTLEDVDLTIGFDTRLFHDIEASDIRISGSMPLANAVSVDNAAGSIRIAAGSVADLLQGGGINAEAVLATINLDFDEAYLQTLLQNDDGSFQENPLLFSLDANLDETVLTRTFDDATGQLNREIASLADLDSDFVAAGIPVTLYEARINLEQQGDGMVLGTQRVIGADASFTNLVRSQDVLQATSEWLNVGNITANNVRVTSVTNANAALVDYQVVDQELASGSFVNGAFVEDGRESTEITASIRILGEAGQVVNLSEGLFFVEADGSDWFHNSGKGSKNLITYQGDLNYDGRVSMKDLAYLNAGAARQVLDDTTGKATAESYARDVDADFSGKIDLADLAVLDADWGKSLHTGDQDFLGSADLSWSDLDLQGVLGATGLSWDNGSFKEQNAVEAAADYVGSLENPAAVGVIGADGDSNMANSDITGTYFLEPVAA